MSNKNMKIGISFGSEYEQRFGEKKYEKMAQHGFTALDYNMSETDTALYSMDEAALEAAMTHEKELAAEAGVEICQVHGPWRFPPKDDTAEDRRERMEKMKRSILATRMMGCKNWVVHPIMPCGIKDLETGETQQTWDLNVEFMKELLAYAESQDVTICLENMPMREFSLAAPQQILDFVRFMDSDHFQVCLDTGHVAIFHNLSLADEVRVLGDSVRVLHVHDNTSRRDNHFWPTRGVIDWDAFADALKDIGFNGVFALETSTSKDPDDGKFEEECVELYGIARKIADRI